MEETIPGQKTRLDGIAPRDFDLKSVELMANTEKKFLDQLVNMEA